jgi:hypothetical protein
MEEKQRAADAAKKSANKIRLTALKQNLMKGDMSGQTRQQQQKDVMVKKVQSKLRLEELHEWKQE